MGIRVTRPFIVFVIPCDQYGGPDNNDNVISLKCTSGLSQHCFLKFANLILCFVIVMFLKHSTHNKSRIR